MCKSIAAIILELRPHQYRSYIPRGWGKHFFFFVFVLGLFPMVKVATRGEKKDIFSASLYTISRHPGSQSFSRSPRSHQFNTIRLLLNFIFTTHSYSLSLSYFTSAHANIYVSLICHEYFYQLKLQSACLKL